MNSFRSHRRAAALAAAVAATGCVLFPAAAAAQGNGNGHAYGLYKPKGHTSSAPSAASAPELQVPGTGIRTFGSWLDDATVMTPGQGSVSLGFSYFRTPAYRELDIPTVDSGVGVTDRVQLNVSVPYYHASEPGGPVVRGLGDLYVSTKIQLRDPSGGGHKVGFSLTPLVEIRSYAIADSSRLSWALPVNIEFQHARWRAFGSAGYFSRGSLFASGAWQASVSRRAAVTASITRSHSNRFDELSDALGLAQTRTDVSGSLSIEITPALSAFGAVGRTISKQDVNSTTLSISSGIAYGFQAWRRAP
jgi:hypothetical protein